MNLTAAEAAELPLAAALHHGDDLLATTPEWRGAGAGAVRYRAHHAVLTVDAADAGPACAELVARLLEALGRAADAAPHRMALRLRMLAAGCALVGGRAAGAAGPASEVLELACAGIAARTALRVSLRDGGGDPVEDAAATALALVQLAANAERHEGATEVELAASGTTFSVSWNGIAAPAQVRTSRQRGDREGWGLGYARVAADSLGGAVYLPDAGCGRRTAVLELGVRRLALPLALVSGNEVQRATTAWDEETGLVPGTAVAPESRAARCVAAASRSSGGVVAVEGWTARRCARGTWLAIPPDGAADRARDVLQALVHERALWEGVTPPSALRIVTLAAVLARALGSEMPRVPGSVWNRRAPEVAAVLGLRLPVPRCTGVAVMDPRVALVLAADLGEGLDADGDDLVLRVRPECRDDALVRVLADHAASRIRLS